MRTDLIQPVFPRFLKHPHHFRLYFETRVHVEVEHYKVHHNIAREHDILGKFLPPERDWMGPYLIAP
jgi:hypothetical protein